MKKINFTLIEIMIAIAIMAFFSTFIGMRTSRALFKYNFSKQTKELSEKLIFAHRMAIVNQYDMEARLFQHGDNSICLCGFDGDKSKEKSLFSSFTAVFRSKEGEEFSDFLITFSSTGNVFPKGSLFLYPKDMHFSVKEIILEDYFVKEIE